MQLNESIHRYPRRITVLINSLFGLLVLIATVNLGALVLRVLWERFGRDETFTRQLPPLGRLVDWLSAGAQPAAFADLLPALGWLAVALFAYLMLRNALPTVRTASRGMLVEFAGAWLPIPWERVRIVKVTEDLAAERFVLLVQPDPRYLTSWHRVYGLAYDLRWHQGFYITSSISDFERLVQTIISECERTTRAMEDVRPLQFREQAWSPLFRLLLSPASFFSRNAKGDTAPAAAPIRPGMPVQATYPARITAIITGATIVIAALAIWRYLGYWIRTLALIFPDLRLIAPFNWTYASPEYVELYNAFRTTGVPFFGAPGRPDLPAPFWLLIAAHLMLLLAFGAIAWLRSLLLDLETRDAGIAVRGGLARRWQLIPWRNVRAFKATEISEQSQILLLQARGLPFSQRLTSLIYDGSLTPGAVITSAIGNFQPLVQQILERLTPLEQPDKAPILQQEARSDLLWLGFSRNDAITAQVHEAKADPATQQIDPRRLWRSARPMLVVALLPALLLLIGAALDGDSVPTLGLIFGTLLLWVIGVIEWPLVGVVSLLLDDKTGGGEEGYRALYLYPASQLPRVLPLLAALALQILGLPVLAVLAWIGAIVWAYWLASTLFTQLYQWEGSQAVLGGLLPVIWQLLTVLGFLLLTR